MVQRTALRFARWLTAFGTALVIIGCFLPLRIVTIPPVPISYGAAISPEVSYVTSFWSIFVDDINSFTKYPFSWTNDLATFLFLLVISLQFLISIAMLLNLLDELFLGLLLACNLIGEILGISEILFVLWMPAKWFHALPIVTIGPGFWLMLSGFLLCTLMSFMVIRILESPAFLAVELSAKRGTRAHR